jgi:hypothetical protein
MKKISLALGLMLAAQAGLMAQGGGNTFKITGRLKNLQAARVYLVYAGDNKEVFDSTTVKNGTYIFTGVVTESNPATLLDVSPAGRRPLSGHMTKIFLLPESFSITHIDSFSNTVITGSPVNADFKRFLDEEKSYGHRERAMLPAFQAALQAKDEAKVKAIQAQLKVIKKGLGDTVYIPFIRSHPQSPLALYILQLYAKSNPDAPVLQTLFARLSPAVKASARGQAFAKKLDEIPKN